MKIRRKGLEFRLIRWSIPYINKAKRISFPGLDHIPLFDVGLFFFKGIRDGAITRRASAVAYSLIMALFPAIIFIFTMIPLIPIDNFQAELLLFIESMVPDTVYVAIQKVIEDIITIPHGGVLSIGFAMAFFFASNAVLSLIQSFNASVNVTETRNWWMQQAIAILLIIILSLLVTIGISLISFTHIFLNLLVDAGLMKIGWTYYLVKVGKWVVILAVFFFAYSFLYFLGPARKSKYRFISAGSTLATVLSILITLIFSFYIDHFAKYNALYGSIGTLPVVMLMVYFNCLAIIIGFELNISIVAAGKVNRIRQKEEGCTTLGDTTLH
jgi:membrane protein